MSTQELLSSIQALARTIHDETGMYVAYVENMHTHSKRVDVWIQRRADDFASFKGCEQPYLSSEVSLHTMRDDLATWLVDYRKAKEEA